MFKLFTEALSKLSFMARNAVPKEITSALLEMAKRSDEQTKEIEALKIEIARLQKKP